MDRREFLRTSLAGAGAAAGLSAAAGAASQDRPAEARNVEARPKAELKLGSQLGRIPGKDMREKILRLEEWGGVGIELGGGELGNVKGVQEALKGTRVKVSAFCMGYYPLIDPDPEQRKKGVARLKEAVKPAGELGSTGIIFVPAFNNHPQLPVKEARKVLVDALPEVGEAAAKAGTRILMEPLNRGEAFFLRMLADAASICRDVNSPGIAMMGDFYHMRIEETSDMGAFLSAGKYLHHVHLASRTRVLPGQDDRSFVDGFRGLKMIGYQDYCSLECGCRGKPEEEIPKSFRFLEKQWAEATV